MPVADMSQIQEWAEKLTKEQTIPLLVELIRFAQDAECVRFGDLAPYWTGSGDPLVPGQQPWVETEDDSDAN